MELILRHKSDLMFIAQTWLRQEVDDIWNRSVSLTMDNKFKINCLDRDTGHRVGELKLISCNYLDVKLMDLRKMKTLEFALWKIKRGKVLFEFLGIYHPQPLQLH